ncbi:hypothetical protein LCGC14_2987000 [marine sediment metagenome]|uniref:Uncharacterized protein n=1 Tax=marine sediment metagenome TaxID=412755 RepID=A0A0F8ZW12_9ZZZZ
MITPITASTTRDGSLVSSSQGLLSITLLRSLWADCSSLFGSTSCAHWFPVIYYNLVLVLMNQVVQVVLVAFLDGQFFSYGLLAVDIGTLHRYYCNALNATWFKVLREGFEPPCRYPEYRILPLDDLRMSQAVQVAHTEHSQYALDAAWLGSRGRGRTSSFLIQSQVAYS